MKSFDSTQGMDTPLGLRDIMTFGKYKGSYVMDVIDEDPTYLAWLFTQTHKKLTVETTKELCIALLDIISEYNGKVKRQPKEYYED